MNTIHKAGIASMLGLAAVAAQAATLNVTSNITTNTVWTADNEYVLTKIIYVEPGASLTIAPGTVIRGLPSPAGDFAPGSLVVTKGAKLYANGTPTKPIVMTSFYDTGINGLPYGLMDKDIRGQWGGLILLGNAPTNLQPGSQNRFVEGLPKSTLGEFGGNDPDDSSGSISYLSIMHGGANLAADNEINGLTMGGVGRGTHMSHIEIYANEDDGIEWFGGTVNLKYAVVAWCGDDGWDTDYGWSGAVQFGFSIMSDQKDNGDQGSEQDGGQDSDGDMPYGMTKFMNMTILGDGVASSDRGTRAAIWRDNAANSWVNSIFTDFSGEALSFEDRKDKEDSFNRLSSGDLQFKNNLIGLFGKGNTWAELVRVDDQKDGHINLVEAAAAVHAKLQEDKNVIVDPYMSFISRVRDRQLDPRPLNVAATTDLYPVDSRDPFFKQVGFKGAFEPGAPLWTDGWTALYNLGYTKR
jgi:hypothetical protein